jgi:hypothetical protein
MEEDKTMPDPTVKLCPQDAWTKVATDQIFGFLQKMSGKPEKYLFTYRMTGNPPPLSNSEGAVIFSTGENERMFYFEGVDIYVMPVGANGVVRADFTG